MKITTIGIDLAKSVFQIHGVDAQGNTCSNLHLKSGRPAFTPDFQPRLTASIQVEKRDKCRFVNL